MASASFPMIGQITGNLPHLHMIAGSMVTAASPTRNTGKGFMVSKTSTGVFRVTFNRRQGYIICATGTLRMAAGSARFLKGPVSSNSNQYIEFRVEDAAGAAADPGTSDVIDFVIWLTKTKLSVV